MILCSYVNPLDKLFTNYISAQLKVKNHVSVSQPKVFWKNETFASLIGSSKLIIVIVTIVDIETIIDSYHDRYLSFRNLTEYQMQKMRSEINSLASVTKAEVVVR